MKIDDMLFELIKYTRETTDVVKVDRMARVVADQIEREISARVVSAMSAQMSLIDQVCGGHA
jgi:hypothetical protein